MNSDLVFPSDALPVDVEEHVRSFQRATSAVAAYRAIAPDLAMVVRRLARWSDERCPPLRFAPKGEKDQSTVSFLVARTSRVLWMAYPASKQGDPKVEFLVRASKYSSEARVAEFRAELVSRGVRSSPGKPNEVLAVPLKRLQTPACFEGTLAFLAWAVSLPDLATAEA